MAINQHNQLIGLGFHRTSVINWMVDLQQVVPYADASARLEAPVAASARPLQPAASGADSSTAAKIASVVDSFQESVGIDFQLKSKIVDKIKQTSSPNSTSSSNVAANHGFFAVNAATAATAAARLVPVPVSPNARSTIQPVRFKSLCFCVCIHAFFFFFYALFPTFGVILFTFVTDGGFTQSHDVLSFDPSFSLSLSLSFLPGLSPLHWWHRSRPWHPLIHQLIR
jgi:hypothetical protein